MSRRRDQERTIVRRDRQLETVARQLAREQLEVRNVRALLHASREQRERAEKLAQLWADRARDEQKRRFQAERQMVEMCLTVESLERDLEEARRPWAWVRGLRARIAALCR